mgnify:CR=1 FL=1
MTYLFNDPAAFAAFFERFGRGQAGGEGGVHGAVAAVGDRAGGDLGVRGGGARGDLDLLGELLGIALVIGLLARADAGVPSSGRGALVALDLQIRPRAALSVRRDPFGRFVSAVVYLPRDRYNTEIRTFPGRIWHKLMYSDMPIRENFEATAENAEQAPQVQFQ